MNRNEYFDALKSAKEEPHLKHYGVLGMRWGVRRAKRKAKEFARKEYESGKTYIKGQISSSKNSAKAFATKEYNNFKTGSVKRADQFADRVYSHIDNGSAGAAAASAAMAYHFTRKATKQMRKHGTPKQKFGASMLTAGAASVGALAGYVASDAIRDARKRRREEERRLNR